MLNESIGGTKKKLIFTNIRCFSCAYAAFRLWKSFYGGKYRSGSHFSFDTRVNSSRIMRLLQSYRIYEYRTSTHGTQCRSSSTYVRNTRVYIYMYIGKFKIKLFTFAFGLRVCFFFTFLFWHSAKMANRIEFVVPSTILLADHLSYLRRSAVGIFILFPLYYMRITEYSLQFVVYSYFFFFYVLVF